MFCKFSPRRSGAGSPFEGGETYTTIFCNKTMLRLTEMGLEVGFSIKNINKFNIFNTDYRYSYN
jgi:hypothetical protein